MRHSVTTPSYLFRKHLDNFLYSLTSPQIVPLSSLIPTLTLVPYPSEPPGGWLPLYTMVTFRPDISYATVKNKAARQARILAGVWWVGATLLGLIGVYISWIARMTLARVVE
jgi:kynurenine 3-monooxygenase